MKVWINHNPMRNNSRRVGSIALLLLVLAGGISPLMAANEPQTVDARLVLYREQEPGTEPYPVRILVTPDFVRFDDGHNDSDFVLYDRHRQRITSVVHEDRSVMEFSAPRQLTLLGVQRPTINKLIEDDPQAPKIEDLPVKLLSITADGEECLHAAVVPGLLPGVVEALAEYHALIEKRNISELSNTPEEMRTPCYLANQVFDHGSQYDFGFPVQEAIRDGRSRVLMDYGHQLVGSELFWIPEDYHPYVEE